MRALRSAMVLQMLSLAVVFGFAPNRAFADLGFVCQGEPQYKHAGQYHPLANADFGTKSYKDSPRTIIDCELSYLVLDKKISKADLVGLKIFAEKYPRSLANGMFWLNSPGGDLMTAVEIAKYIRKKGMQTLAFDGGDGFCYSSCVVVLAGGIERHAFAYFEGELSIGGGIGIHRPYAVTASTGLSDSATEKRLSNYKEALKDAFRELRVPIELADKMMAISPIEIRILTYDEVKYYGFKGLDPVHETRMLNFRATASGMSLREYIRREQSVASKCDGSGPGYFQCRSRVWPVGLNWAVYSSNRRKAISACGRNSYSSRFFTRTSDIDYEKWMGQWKQYSECKGKIMRGN
jgi:hypothetical protein